MRLSKRIGALEATEGPQRPHVDGLGLTYRIWSAALNEWQAERTDAALLELVLCGTAVERRITGGDVLPVQKAARFNGWRDELNAIGDTLEDIRTAFEQAGWIGEYRRMIHDREV